MLSGQADYVLQMRMLQCLLADPEDARDPDNLRGFEGADGVVGIERDEFDLRFCLTAKHLCHHLPIACLGDDTVALAHLRARRNDDAVAFAIGWLHTVARDFQRIDGLPAQTGKTHLVPAAAHGKAAIVEEAVGARLGQTDKGGARPAPAFDERGKIIHARPDGFQCPGNALAGRPARTAILGLAF